MNAPGTPAAGQTTLPTLENLERSLNNLLHLQKINGIAAWQIVEFIAPWHRQAVSLEVEAITADRDWWKNAARAVKTQLRETATPLATARHSTATLQAEQVVIQQFINGVDCGLITSSADEAFSVLLIKARAALAAAVVSPAVVAPVASGRTDGERLDQIAKHWNSQGKGHHICGWWVPNPTGSFRDALDAMTPGGGRGGKTEEKT